MDLICIGLSHKTAPLSVREKLALNDESQGQLLPLLAAGREAMIVSTCNRVEFYAAGSIERAREQILSVISTFGGPEALQHLYEHQGEAALIHLFRVAGSLDSMVVGEPQILGQVKDAFELATRAGAAKGELTRACGAAFASSKRVRTETGVGRAATSMASAAVALASKIFGGLSDKSVLMVGAGEMAELAARHLKSAGASQLRVINRTLARAEELATSVGGTAHPFEELLSLLVPADVVICSTASMHPVLTKEKVAGVLKARKFRPLFLVDLAVPRDVAADVNELEGVYAYDVDDIQKVVLENSQARAAEAAKAEVIVAEEVARFVRARSVREGVPVLAQLRSRGEEIARLEAEKTLAHLGELSEKQRRSVEAMAMAIVNKLLHQPTAKLRALSPHDQQLAGAAAELFGLTGGIAKPEEEPVTPLAVAGVHKP